MSTKQERPVMANASGAAGADSLRSDLAQDRATARSVATKVVKSAIRQHDDQLHSGRKTKLKFGYGR